MKFGTPIVFFGAKRIWRGLPLCAKAVAVAFGIVALTAWVIVGATLAVALYESPLGCPPTMGCHTIESTDCDSLFTTRATNSTCDK